MLRLRRSGLAAFAVVAAGQTLTMLGARLTSFAMGVWVYKETGSVTQFALVSFFALVPGILFGAVGGALIDRWDRRWAVILSDTGAALGALALAILFWTGKAGFWPISAVVAVTSVCAAFQFPALTALTTEMVPKHDLGRANGFLELGGAVSTLAAPLLAGVLMEKISVQAIILLDFLTLFPAVLTVLLVPAPLAGNRPGLPAAEAPSGGGALLREAAAGWRYIRQRPGLTGMLVLFFVVNFAFGAIQTLITPLVLSFASSAVLGTVLSTAGLGMLLGGGAVTVWGNPRRRIAAILVMMVIQGSMLLLSGLRPNAVLIAAAAFIFIAAQPVTNTCSQAIWQSKIPLAIQGRVFSIRRMVAMSAIPLALLVSGPLSDRVLGPLLAPGGALAGTVGRVIGTGPGRGIALLFMILGCLMLAAAAVGARYEPLRRVEDDLPDAIPDTLPDDLGAGLAGAAAE
ncbi:MAG TPA: MFS transporter [Thermoanaerobaculia bacterium]|nr:MFS transporter [Thermoanaerobaculia bacterium]